MTENIIERNHFSLKARRDIPEMQGTLWEMEHAKSGAKLAWLQRQDENMTFAVGLIISQKLNLSMGRALYIGSIISL